MKALGKALAVVMLLALVGAGTATAAKLITGADVANGTLTGADIMNGTVKKKDLSHGAKASLQGAVGPAGANGPAGPAGPEGPAGPAGSADRYAELNADGTLTDDVKGIDETLVSHPDTGVYCFTFPTDERPKAGAANGVVGDVSATLQIEAAGGITSCPAEANVRVVTFDLSVGAAADRAFRVLLENS